MPMRLSCINKSNLVPRVSPLPFPWSRRENVRRETGNKVVAGPGEWSLNFGSKLRPTRQKHVDVSRPLTSPLGMDASMS